jgi:hypothetical protein
MASSWPPCEPMPAAAAPAATMPPRTAAAMPS